MENNEKHVSKGRLAIILSKLSSFQEAKVSLEQYPTDSEIAAEVLTQGSILGDFTDKKVIDLGSGTGILGIGALLLGAEKVLFVEKDTCAITTAEKNLENIKSENLGKAWFVNKDIAEFSDFADTVVMNPPFGTRKEHSDKLFLEKAFKMAKVIYSFHKTSTKKFVETFCQDNGFRITHSWGFEFPIKNTMNFHEKKIKKISVTAFRFQQI